jgi:hypothetical protein
VSGGVLRVACWLLVACFVLRVFCCGTHHASLHHSDIYGSDSKGCKSCLNCRRTLTRSVSAMDALVPRAFLSKSL